MDFSKNLRTPNISTNDVHYERQLTNANLIPLPKKKYDQLQELKLFISEEFQSFYEEFLFAASVQNRSDDEFDFCFAISYRRENIRQYELRALSEMDCKNWIEAIREASFNKLLLQKEELEQKHLHLLQIVESEKTAKWQYTQQCEELATEIKKLRAELFALKKEWKPSANNQSNTSLGSDQGVSTSNLFGPYSSIEHDSVELKKIKKVQSFFRGWLCRRRWKQIVEQYIKSPHAESMRKRNSLVFRMVESEEEYMEQMEVLVSCFLRPFKMAASSKRPPCTHEDVNSIFLNTETVLFLHQIFLKGLTSRLENWPTLVLGDLFSMLLPMLSIYQEYVRNHHYSLQVLTECKQSAQFSALLKRLEGKPSCHGRSLETFLTYPMHQVPRYIITLHELLAHTPHDHVERKSLQSARQQLEDLSRQMHDEVSETENLRKNLAVERMIVEGCDILLDVNQVFVRQGSLIQLPSDKPKSTRTKLSFKTDKEDVRQCFLFSNHLIIATRSSNGKLHLVPEIGKIALAEAMLIEEPSENNEDEVGSVSSHSSEASDIHERDFKIIVEKKTGNQLVQLVVHLLATSAQEKASWTSDISQCLDSVHFNDIMRPSMTNDTSSPQKPSSRGEAKMFRDQSDLRFSRTLSSCKVPQVRYASPERLLHRLTDLRFLSIDFLNTFLLTYRLFTDGVTVLEALRKVFYSNEPEAQGSVTSLEAFTTKEEHVTLQLYEERRRSSFSPRRISGASSVSGYGSEMSERDRSHSYDSQGHRHWKATLQKYDEEGRIPEAETSQPKIFRQSPTSTIHKIGDSLSPPAPKSVSIRVEKSQEDDRRLLSIPKVAPSSSSDTLTELTVLSAPCSPSNLSSVTLVASSPSDSNANELGTISPHHSPSKSKETSPIRKQVKEPSPIKEMTPKHDTHRRTSIIHRTEAPIDKRIERCISEDRQEQTEDMCLFFNTLHRASCSSSRSESISTTATNSILQGYYGMRRSIQEGDARASFQCDATQKQSKAGVVITSSREAKRRSSTSSSAAAFAIATSASSNPRDLSPSGRERTGNADLDEEMERARHNETVISTAATMRVLNVLRHWISKHPQDFEDDHRLRNLTLEFLDDIIYSPNLLPAEHKAASQLRRLLTREREGIRIDMEKLLNGPCIPSKESIETLSALEIAEQLTFVDHQIFVAIASQEFLGQAWMKNDKMVRAPHVLMMTKRFNDVSRLVASGVLRRKTLSARVAVIEKWTAVADICRCLHNFNGVLQICSAFTNTAIFRLKKTWEKVSKTTKQTLEKLQHIVSSDGRFRSLRDALHRCDPPCIPYLGLYLTDLSFIEEGTPNFTKDALLNFSKMRMISHVIREIRHFQQTPYKIELNSSVTNYLVDPSLLMDDEELYNASLEMEPRTSRLSTSGISHQLSFSSKY